MAAKKSVELSGVVVARSAISSIDPDEGVLMYRGYDIAELADHSTYEEVCWLLLHGELPGPGPLAAFQGSLATDRPLPPEAVAAAGLGELARHGAPAPARGGGRGGSRGRRLGDGDAPHRRLAARLRR